jgi:hypothetical protein
MGQATIAPLAAFFTLATGGVYRFVDCGNHRAYGDSVRVFAQQVTTAWPTHAGHQAILTQTGKQLFQIRERDTLAFGNIRQWYRPFLGV